MKMKLFAKLFGVQKQKSGKEAVPVMQTVKKEVSAPYLTQTVVFGMHQYRTEGEDSSVFFVDESRGIRKLLIDAEGRFQNFPGIAKESFWVKAVPANALKPQIRYRTSFEKREGKWLLMWEIQPDGQYWADDDGFGAEKDSEVVLHTYVDMDGNYTGPFRIYCIGSRIVSLDRFENVHGRDYEQALAQLREGKVEEETNFLFPRLSFLEITVGIHRVSDYYTLCNIDDVMNYWKHPVLSSHLAEAAQVLLKREEPVSEIIPYPYDKAVRGSMTLFYDITGDPLFKEVLDKCFGGNMESLTLKYLSWMKNSQNH